MLPFDDPEATWKLWASESRRQSASLRATLALHTAATDGGASLLPTPTATPYGSTNNGCPHDGRTAYRTRGTPSLATMARKGLLPTPTVGDSRAAGNRTLPGSNAHPGYSLTDVVVRRTWPTPDARCWKSGKGRKPNGHAPQLEAVVARFPTPRSHHTALDGGARAREMVADSPELAGGTLNPTWVEWLMGWPIGWTASEPSATEWSRWRQQWRSELSRLGIG